MNFSSAEANKLLKNKCIYFFGSSNTRGLYKDLIWLLGNSGLIPIAKLKDMNEPSYEGDSLLSKGKLGSGIFYEEVREYSKNLYLKFQFITRLFLPAFIDSIHQLDFIPDVVVINSCLWDLCRWETEGFEQYRDNIHRTFKFLKEYLPDTLIIWLTAYPIGKNCRCGVLNDSRKEMRSNLPHTIVTANLISRDAATLFDVDILDLHYHFKPLIKYHTDDGVHWQPRAVRYATNLLLTHIASSWNRKLPSCVFDVDKNFPRKLKRSNSNDHNKSVVIKKKAKKYVTKRNKTYRNYSNYWPRNTNCNMQPLYDFMSQYYPEHGNAWNYNYQQASNFTPRYSKPNLMNTSFRGSNTVRNWDYNNSSSYTRFDDAYENRRYCRSRY